MSRHLYDLERIMDTVYGQAALSEVQLYQAIVEHRKKFYHLGYVDYAKDAPDQIAFVPTGAVLEAYRADYNENMVDGYIYGTAIPFDELIVRLEGLQRRFHQIK